MLFARSLSAALLCTVVVSFAALAVVAATPAHAQDDVRKEVRLLMFDGKFTEARTILDAAPEDVRNDVKFRIQLAEAAERYIKRRDGEERRGGLLAMRDNYGAAYELDGEQADAIAAAVAASQELHDLDVEGNRPERAIVHARWSCNVGGAALEAGIDTVEFRRALADAYSDRAKLLHKINDFDQIVADFTKSADLLASCAEGDRDEAQILADASRVLLDLGLFIAEQRPIEEETRDEESITKAIELATRAGEVKGATQDVFTQQLLALRAAHQLEIEGDFPPPFMQELGKREGIPGLELAVPRAKGWDALEKSELWDLVWNRQLEGDYTAVQIMLKMWSKRAQAAPTTKTWGQVEEVALARFEREREGMSSVTKATEPEFLGEKKGAQIWYWEVAGTKDNRARVIAEWVWFFKKKDQDTYQLRIIDWRTTPDLGEPDIDHFVKMAIGKLEEDDGKKKGGRKR